MVFVVSNSIAEVGYKVGNTAPGFTSKSLDGKSYSLASLHKGKHALLVFWAVDCVYCYSHLDDYKTVQLRFAKQLNVVGINTAGESREQVSEYVKDNKLNYLVLFDKLNNLDVAESYRVLGTPTLVLISPQGKVLFYGHNMPKLEKWLK